jgi:hypothetical protein
LVALVFAMFTALYRNWRYQNYAIHVRRRIWLEAARDEQRCRNDLFLGTSLPVFGWNTGRPIDINKWKADFAKTDDELQLSIDKRIKEEKHRVTEFVVAGNLCLISICIAMVSLVVLAWLNF